MLAFGLLCAVSLFGQRRRFSWQDACFKNPALPYCKERDFAIKPVRPSKAAPDVLRNPSPSMPGSAMPVLITLDGMDWRFADPSADAVAGISFRRVSASPIARSLMTRLGASQGLTEAGMKKVFAGLSAMDQVAISVRDDQIVLQFTGNVTVSTFPVLEAGWKAVPAGPGATLVGHAEAVDQALQRVGMKGPLTELTRLAEQQQANADFWMTGSGKLTGPEAVSAGVKRFSLTASFGDRLTSDTVIEFSGVPDANAVRMWSARVGAVTINGNTIRTGISLEAAEVQQKLDEIIDSPLGRHLGMLVKAARYLPAGEATATENTKAVIYGLEGGPREVDLGRKR